MKKKIAVFAALILTMVFMTACGTTGFTTIMEGYSDGMGDYGIISITKDGETRKMKADSFAMRNLHLALGNAELTNERYADSIEGECYELLFLPSYLPDGDFKNVPVLISDQGQVLVDGFKAYDISDIENILKELQKAYEDALTDEPAPHEMEMEQGSVK